MSTTEVRTLVKTSTSGWYIDASNPDGNRVRKREGDRIIDREEYETEKTEKTDIRSSPAQTERTSTEKLKSADQRDKEDNGPSIVSDTGKVLRGPTTSIKCKWRGLDGKDSVCGAERTIKVQDAFQVRYCVTHQKEHRKALRREKMKRERAAKKR